MNSITLVRPYKKSRKCVMEVFYGDHLLERSWFSTKKSALAYASRYYPKKKVSYWIENSD